MNKAPMDNRPVVVFDGVCNFCNGAVNFIIERDRCERFVFAASQSAAGRALMARHGFGEHGLETILLIRGGECLTKTDAALAIAADLTGPWRMLRHLKVIPRPIRNYFYDLFARHRYRLFGRKDSCPLPSRELRNRFL